ncbi:MAG: hypothetical protein WBW84_21250 [Acidobacteriaceae bacterium]
MKVKSTQWIAACVFLAAVCGCSTANKPTDANFIKALNSWYDNHNECLFPQGHAFPYEVAPGPTAKQDEKQLDALTDAGLMTRLKDLTIHVERYTLNAAGNRYGPRFCYGHREVTGIASFTPPGPRDGFTETTVRFQYTMHEVPVWARSEAVEKAFPELAQSLGSSPTGQKILANAGAGWHVPE